MSKRRAFDASDVETPEPSAPAPAKMARTEPAPLARTAVALVLASWVLPLAMLVSILHYTEDDQGTLLVHRVISISSAALLGAGLLLSVRGILRARTDPRVRRRLAVAGLVLSVLTPAVWGSELVFAWQMFLTRQALDAAESDASSSPAE